MFFIINSDERPEGWVSVSYSNDWVVWLNRNLPNTLDLALRERLNSNLKHIIAGLEMKAALIGAHESSGPGEPNALYEPYFQSLIFEFCVGAFSLLEGLGAAQYLHRIGDTGADGPRIDRHEWRPALCEVFDPDEEFDLNDAVIRTSAVRDKLHQDKVGLREQIDWHELSYCAAFVPASRAIGVLLRRHEQFVPDTTNLRPE